MPVRYIKRSSTLGPGETSKPNANPIRVDSDTDTMKFGTGTSGTTEKEVMDLSSTQTVTGAKSFTADGADQFAEVALTNAEIKALRASPKTLIAAPGAGKMIMLRKIVLLLDAGTNVLTETAANLDVRFVGVASPVLLTLEATGFIDQAADTSTQGLVASDKIVSKANSENKGIELFNNGAGEYGGNAANDALLRAKLWYSVISTGW